MSRTNMEIEIHGFRIAKLESYKLRIGKRVQTSNDRGFSSQALIAAQPHAISGYPVQGSILQPPTRKLRLIVIV
jgi:hypothetical protein